MWEGSAGGSHPNLTANESNEEVLKTWISCLCPKPTKSESFAEGPWWSVEVCPALTGKEELLGWMTMENSSRLVE